MTDKDDRKVGITLAGAGAAVVGAAVVFGLTTEGGGPDWISIIMALGGLVMAVTGLLRAHAATPGPSR